MITAQNFIQLVSDDPSLAIRLMRALAAMRGQPAALNHITDNAGMFAHDVGRAVRLLDNLCEAGLVQKKTNGWCLLVEEYELDRLELLAEGAAAACDCYRERDTVKLVITYPGFESSFIDELRSTGPYYASVPHTAESFITLAAQARQRLVVMTPFLDKYGVELVGRMFAVTAVGVEKTLIVRDWQRLAASDAGAELALLAKCATLLDYMILNPKRPGCYETFHSKVILCDSGQAYIGSANLVNSSLSLSLELGVVVRGETVILLSKIVDSIIARLNPVVS